MSNSQSPLDSPLATVSKNPAGNPYREFPEVKPDTNDPAFQPPRDPLADIRRLRASTGIINRELPNPIVQTGWSIQEVREAIASHVTGLFDASAQLVDAINSDSRVHSSMSSRVGGLLGRALNHYIPAKYKDSAIAKECYDAWISHWPSMGTEPVLSDMLMWGCELGFWVGQQLWDTSGKYWLPYLQSWHPRYTYYHWKYRTFVAITLDGQVPISSGDGHWVLHAPFGENRGWMRGALRAIAPWWLARNYALRDWARASERHGMPIGKAVTPFGAAPEMVNKFRNDLSTLGQESIIQLPQSPDPMIGSYDLEWLETNASAWQAFEALIQQCNAEITLAVLGQNLTSEVKEGSFAAARVHADVRQAILEADARALSQTIYKQIARPFAAINFGDPDLAPRSVWDIVPFEDNKANADAFVAFASAVNLLKTAGIVVNNPRELGLKFGLVLGSGDIEQIKSEASPIRAYHLNAGVVRVNEVRRSIGLDPIPGEEGEALLKPSSGGESE